MANKQLKLILIFLAFSRIIVSIDEELEISILGTNDYHGAGLEIKRTLIIDGVETKYDIGGYKLLSGLINIIKKSNPKGFLWLDAGDRYFGTQENEKTNGEIITDFYNQMELKATALGNHEWDAKKKGLIAYIKNSNFPFVVANLERKKEEEIQLIISKLNAVNDAEKIAEHKISLEKEISDYKSRVFKTQILKFHDDKISIGIIGLTTFETYTSITDPPNDYDIRNDYAEIITSLSKELRDQKVNSVIVLSHIGLKCTVSDEKEFKKNRIRMADDETNNKIICNEKEIASVLGKLKTGVIDAWVAGHHHDTIHHFRDGVPIIQNPMGGRFVNLIQLYFKKNDQGAYELQRQKSQIQGPIPMCTDVFIQTDRCDSVPKVGNKKMKQNQFLGQKLVDNYDEKVKQLFLNPKYSTIISSILADQTKILFTVEGDFSNEQFEYNSLGALFGQAIRTNFAKNNSYYDKNNIIVIQGWGCFRTQFQSGKVSNYDMLQMLPFNEQLAYRTISGAQLLKIIEIIQQGRKPFYAVTGVKMSVNITPKPKYVKGSATLENGSLIDLKQKYLLIVDEFMIKDDGGDDFACVLLQGVLLRGGNYVVIKGLQVDFVKGGLENKTYHLQNFLDNRNLFIVPPSPQSPQELEKLKSCVQINKDCIKCYEKEEESVEVVIEKDNSDQTKTILICVFSVIVIYSVILVAIVLIKKKFFSDSKYTQGPVESAQNLRSNNNIELNAKVV